MEFVKTDSDSSDLNQRIDEAIKNCGIFIVAVSDVIGCEKCNCSECASDDSSAYTKVTDGFVYTIGHRNRNRPDFIVHCGPLSGKRMTHDQLRNEMFAAVEMMNFIVSDWENNPLGTGYTCMTSTGRTYYVDSGPADINKKNFTTMADQYYGDGNYELLVLTPMLPKSDEVISPILPDIIQ